MESYFEVSPGVDIAVSYPDRPQTRSLPRPMLQIARPLGTQWSDVLLAWQPSFPTRIWTREPYWRSQRSGWFVTAPLPPLIASNMHWQPIFPDRPSRRQPLVASQPQIASPPPSVFLTVDRLMSWAPSYPTRVWSRRQSWSSASGVTVTAPPVLPAVFAAGLPCVEFARVTYATPTLLSTTVTAPAALLPVLTRSTLITGTFC